MLKQSNNISVKITFRFWPVHIYFKSPRSSDCYWICVQKRKIVTIFQKLWQILKFYSEMFPESDGLYVTNNGSCRHLNDFIRCDNRPAQRKVSFLIKFCFLHDRIDRSRFGAYACWNDSCRSVDVSIMS